MQEWNAEAVAGADERGLEGDARAEFVDREEVSSVAPCVKPGLPHDGGAAQGPPSLQRLRAGSPAPP